MNQVPLIITANSWSRPYGAAIVFLTASYSGFVNGDTPGNITQPTITVAATAASLMVLIRITASGAAGGNYIISYVSGIYTVNPVALTITANNQSKVQGSVNPTLTVAYSGFKNGDTQASLTTLPTVTTTATTGSPAGSYPITVSGAVDANYTISYAQGTLTVTAGTTLTFGPISSKVYGTADFSPGATSGLSITYTSGNPAVATIVGGNIHIVGAGTSVITATSGAGSLQQTLTVTPATLSITANNQSKSYGAANPALTVSYSGFVNGDTQAS